MNIEFFKQKKSDSVSVGDEIAVFAGRDDFLQSGRYIVGSLHSGDDGEIMANLVGMNAIEGHVAFVDIGAH